MMKSSVAETSYAAYQKIISTGYANVIQQRICFWLAQNPRSTRREISTAINIEISCISGRVRELLDAGVLIEIAPRPCKITNNKAAVLDLAYKHPLAQAELRW